MFALRRYALPRRLQVVLGLALMGLAVAPSARGAAPLDTANATGNGGYWSNVSIHAVSGTSGESPGGTVTFSIGSLYVSGPVTCLRVTGPDRGGGSAVSPTIAIINAAPTTILGGVVTVELVDNGGNGADVMSAQQFGRTPTDCSHPANFVLNAALTDGRAVVFDAPVLPTFKSQCKNGGWRNYPQFKNQGQCVAFVVKQAQKKCLAERAKIGVLAFRNKYGLGPHHVRAMRRCVNQASR